MNPVAIEIPYANGTVLRGMRSPVRENWVALLHEPGEAHDLDDVAPLMPAIVNAGATAVAIDLRGYGMSDGERPSKDAAVDDIGTIVAWMRDQGAASVAMVGVGASCHAILEEANRKKIEACVLISPPPDVADSRNDRKPRGAGEPKLIICGAADPVFRDAANDVRRRSIGWALTVLPGTSAQGAALIAGTQGPRVREAISAFFREQWSIGLHRGVPAAASSKEELA